jgi:YhgE/Pip-like protein
MRDHDIEEHGGTEPGMLATRLLRTRAVWTTPLIVTSLLIALISLIYIGSVVNPTANLHGLPVLVVNQDQGAAAGSHYVDLGEDVVSALTHSSAVTTRLSINPVTLAQAHRDMDQNAAFATIVIPRGFTDSVLALYGIGSQRHLAEPIPAAELLTNARAGSVGVSLATGVVQPAIAAISRQVGQQVSAMVLPGGQVTANLTAERANPVTLLTVPYRPLPQHTALGLTAFYISLLAIMCGFLGAVLINSTVDAALGYATTEIGPKWRQSVPVRISRWQTLLAKWAMALVLSPLLTGVMLLVAVGITKMYAPHIAELWLFTSFAAIVIAFGTLTLFAAFGILGQLIAMLAFIYLALASSGGTIPLQALPAIFRFVANFEPLRQILDGSRAILYFNASGPAGLNRGLILTGIGLVFWVGAGLAVTRLYDRKGLVRMQPELMDYVTRSVRAYPDRNQATATADSDTAQNPVPQLPDGKLPDAAGMYPERIEGIVPHPTAP